MIEILVSPPETGTPPRHREPVRLGVPVAAGRLSSIDRAALFDPAGRRRMLQARALDRWHDGSVRWVLIDFLADHDGSRTSATYTLGSSVDGDAAPIDGDAISVRDDGGVLSIATGGVRIDVEQAGPRLFRHVQVGGAEAVDSARTGLLVESDEGPMPVTIDRASIEDAGPVRVVVRLEGSARAGSRTLNVTIRLHAFAGSADIRLDITLHNPAPAVHPGNFWELGEPGSILIRDASLHVAWPAGSPPPLWSCSTAEGAPAEPCGSALSLWQASSGGQHWSSGNHVDRHGHVALAFKGYRLTGEACAGEGDRATPIVQGAHGARAIAIAVPHFWQNFPKAIDASAQGLTFRMFPHQHAGGHELQPGEQKTHVSYVAFAAAESPAPTLHWARAPVFARNTAEHYTSTGVFPYVLALGDDPNRDYSALVQAALDAEDGFESKRELIDEYGWRNFGDIYADHERVYYKGPPPVHSHYNNQYDALAGLARQFARSGDPRWWRQLCELATHVIDIDVYRTSGDKSAYSHGLFWHTGHYVDAGRSTHRSYPRAAGVSGGGPSSEHNYTTGLLLYYFLTGDTAGRDTAVMLARWVVEMDDGTRTVFRWLSRGDTGLASATYEPTYQGPGRGAGHSIAALLDGYRLTGDALFLAKAEALIRRCIHPGDDINARGLLDMERRWSYTIFLHVLGRYLDEKAALGQIDAMYAYARQSLLAYAAWMRVHERPYLDRLDELEYPTETWAAQELWKSEVFTYAAKYTDDAEARTGYLERADYFFRYAISTLRASPTRTLARPLVLLLSRGLMHGYVSRRPDSLTAAPGADLAPGALPPPFVPQRVVALRRARLLAAGLALIVVTAAVAAVWLLQSVG